MSAQIDIVRLFGEALKELELEGGTEKPANDDSHVSAVDTAFRQVAGDSGDIYFSRDLALEEAHERASNSRVSSRSRVSAPRHVSARYTTTSFDFVT